MIDRYTLPEMGAIWAEENKFRKWLQVEMAVCEELAERGLMPQDALSKIKERAAFSVQRIKEIEKVVKHDVIAFLACVAEHVGPEARYIHLGLTSNDIVDTAQALQIKEASELILAEMRKLSEAIKRRAFEHKDTVMAGRTHGVHAEATTFGLKLAVWYSEMQRNIARFERAAKTMRFGKLSGPVGTFSHLPPEIEEAVCARLGLNCAPVSTQILQRDSHAEYVAALAIIASSYDKFATEIRHLQRTEVREAEEPFEAGQKGSSAMPHKRNPVSCEQISGLARLVRCYAQAAFENVALWHERDISHSSVERVILPDSTILVHYLTRQMTNIIDKMVVYPERMRQNLDLTRGMIFSGQILLALTHKGVDRDQAYAWVQRCAMRVWDEGLDFKDLIRSDPDIRRHLSPQEIDAAFDLRSQLKHVDRIFARVFADEQREGI